MLTNHAETVFFTTFYKLKQYSEDTIKIERATDERNSALPSLLQANSFNINSDIQQRVLEAIMVQRR